MQLYQLRSLMCFFLSFSLVSFKFIALQQNFNNNASSSSGTSNRAPEHQSNDDQDNILTRAL